MEAKQQPSGKRIVIIGAGISGLAAVHRLQELCSHSATPPEFCLLESSSNPGGVIRTHVRDGFLMEGGPDMFSVEKPEALSLAKRLGLADHLIKTNSGNRRSFIVRRGKLVPVPEGFQLLAPSRFWPFITSGIFSFPGKLRMGMDLIIPRRNTGNGSDESLADFVRRRFGREALERMAQPMIGGIYTADPEKLSIGATMPRLAEMERAHRSLIYGMLKDRRNVGEKNSRGVSGARYGLFHSFDKGMQLIVDGIARDLPRGTLHLNTHVASIAFDPSGGHWTIRTGSNHMMRADALCLALPAFASATLLRDANPELARELDEIQYASTATINLAYKREDISHALDGFGFVVPFIEKRSMLACSFSSVKFNGRAPAGSVLFRCFVGGALQPENFAMDDESMLRVTLEDLRDLLGIRKAPLFSLIERWPRSMAQYHIGHIERMRRIDELLKSVPTLRLAGNAFNGAGIPDCIRTGEIAAEQMLAALSGQRLIASNVA